jgi:hypothetical protein
LATAVSSSFWFSVVPLAELHLKGSARNGAYRRSGGHSFSSPQMHAPVVFEPLLLGARRLDLVECRSIASKRQFLQTPL